MLSTYRQMKCIKVAAAIFATVVITGCSSPKLDPIGHGGTVLAFGDSLTTGVGATNADSYPAVLAELTGLNIINAGISGETTEEGLNRLPQELDRSDPDLIILIEGGNDILRDRRHSDIKENLKRMIDLAKDRDIPVVLIGIPQKALLSDSAPLYEQLAEEYQLVFDGTLIAELERSPSLKSDHIHFNKEGYRKMAESIYQILKEYGALL